MRHQKFICAIILVIGVAGFGCQKKAEYQIVPQFRINPQFQLQYADGKSYTVDSTFFWNPESTTMEQAANNDVYGYDYYAKRLYKFDANARFVKAMRSIRDSAGRYYNSMTDFTINRQGEIVLYDNVSGQVVFCDSSTGATKRSFQARSTNWFSIIQTKNRNYILANPSQMSKLPILRYYDSSGAAQGEFGEAEDETQRRKVNIIGLRKLAYCDEGDTLFITNPAVYQIQKYLPNGEKQMVFGVKNVKWQQIEGARDEEKDSAKIGSVVHLLAESKGLLLAFVMTVKPPYQVVEQWIDLYTKGGVYQGSITLNNDVYPMFVDKKGALWFAQIEKNHMLSLNNRTIHLSRYILQIPSSSTTLMSQQ